ncbi:Hypothetical predicted protein [Lecanosticta acicola]|uniref:Uncharacterized protein n=1 Tax=Lecanosticta acicola TaxID=111012 RepID=A0AAI9EF88_9PEZI|nr:Hypothetical predicted protein [Lecanosticta acicola]
MPNALASEIYLVEHWEDHAGLELTERRARIYAEYVALGVAGRWPYHQAARSGSRSPTQAQLRTIITSSRTSREREVARFTLQGEARVWFRIAYGGEGLLSKYSAEEIGYATGPDEGDSLVLEDADRYARFRGLQDALGCMPEIVDSFVGPQDPARHHSSIQDAKEEAAPQLENEDDEEAKEEIRMGMQHAWVTGVMWLEDKEAQETGEALLVWLDEFGRVVRKNRVQDITKWAAMFSRFADNETEWWNTAEAGSVYEAGNWP